MVKTEIIRESRLDFGTASPQELIRCGIETERQESVPVDDLILDDSILDTDHRDKLAVSMRGKRKQISPITVRPRINADGKLIYDIIDGFHRAGALRQIQERTGIKMEAKAVVVYGCTDEELYDLRVLAVNSVRSISFPRMITWMQRSFEQTEWYRMGMTLSQTMAIANNMPWRTHSGLDKDGVYKVREWATEKARIWNKSIGAIYNDTRSVENADPELVKRVRIGGGGKHSKKGELNPTRFRAMVDELPGQYELQRIMADIICNHNLNQYQTRAVAREIARSRDNSETLELIRNDPLATIGEMSGSDDDADEVFADADVAGPDTPETRVRGKKIYQSGSAMRGYTSPDQALQLNPEQEKVITDSVNTYWEQMNNHSPLWYEAIPGMTRLEATVVQLFFRRGEDIDEIAGQLGLLNHKVLSILRSVTRKYLLHREDTELDRLTQSVKKESNAPMRITEDDKKVTDLL